MASSEEHLTPTVRAERVPWTEAVRDPDALVRRARQFGVSADEATAAWANAYEATRLRPSPPRGAAGYRSEEEEVRRFLERLREWFGGLDWHPGNVFTKLGLTSRNDHP